MIWSAECPDKWMIQACRTTINQYTGITILYLSNRNTWQSCSASIWNTRTSIRFPLHSGSPCWQVKGEFPEGISYERERILHIILYIFQVQMWPKSFPSDGTNSYVHFQLKWLACLGVPVGDQSHGHDVLQHGPGGEELLADEDSAAGTETLVVQSDGYWRNRLVRPASIHLHTLLLNLHGSNNTPNTRVVLSITCSKRASS